MIRSLETQKTKDKKSAREVKASFYAHSNAPHNESRGKGGMKIGYPKEEYAQLIHRRNKSKEV